MFQHWKNAYRILILPRICTTGEPSKYKLNLLYGQMNSQKTKYLTRTEKANTQSSQGLVTAELCIALSKLFFKHRFNDQDYIKKILISFGPWSLRMHRQQYKINHMEWNFNLLVCNSLLLICLFSACEEPWIRLCAHWQCEVIGCCQLKAKAFFISLNFLRRFTA